MIKIYRFSVAYKNREYSETFDTEKDIEWLERYDQNELKNHQVLWAEIKKLNGKHVLFGIMESLEQSDDFPNWLAKAFKEQVILTWAEIIG